MRFFQRKPRPGLNYSIEAIFDDVRRRLADRINAEVLVSSCLNDGYLSKFVNIFEAGLRQGRSVNHVTGEVHFLNLLMRHNTIVLTIHDCGFMERKRGVSRAIVRRLYLDGPVARARIVTANSETTKEEVVRYTRCNPDKVRVIPVPVNEAFRPSPREFNATCPTVLQIGTSYNKNIPRLAESLSDINCKVVIVGRLSDEQREALNRYRIDYNNVYNLSQQQMLEQYQRCDIVSFASTFEGFGMPIVEGNMVERVVITSNVSSMPEIAADAACLVDPFDVASIRAGFRRVIGDADYRQSLLENGRANRLRFDGQRIAAQYYELYEEIVNSK